MDNSGIQEAALLLLDLRRRRATIEALPDQLTPATNDEAYAIQDAIHQAAGWTIEVLKVGCTSLQAQEALGIPHPIAGRVPAEDRFGSGDTIDRGVFAGAPLIECEFALRLDAAGKVDAVAPALELVDTRYSSGFAPDTRSLLADNSGSAAVVIGAAVAIEEVGDLADYDVSLTIDGGQVATGTGAAVVGGPWQSVQWVIDHERSRGRDVAAGTWIITGTCTGLTPSAFGTKLTGDFGGLGQVSVTLAR